MLSHKKEKIRGKKIGRKCEALESVGPIIELTQFSFSVVINIIQCDECLYLNEMSAGAGGGENREDKKERRGRGGDSEMSAQQERKMI